MLESLCRPSIAAIEETLAAGQQQLQQQQMQQQQMQQQLQQQQLQSLCTKLDSLAIVLRDTSSGVKEEPQRLAAVQAFVCVHPTYLYSAEWMAVSFMIRVCVHPTYLYAAEWMAVSFANEGLAVRQTLAALIQQLAAAGFQTIKNYVRV
ncbi:hypothetical protein EBH_0064170 [Eimeria brunetti]|uniref:Uncharacterized protein n=1 Tax=Eimeria brunetti TaxID=51314 RepID=U6LC28_9EIME|nr:hypothetical protein EBH_0064170 [Eimeria brunetti]